DVAAEGIDVHSMEGRARFSKIAAPLLNELPQGVYRELMFTNLAKRTGLDRATLMELTREKAPVFAEPEPIVEPAPSAERNIFAPTPGNEPIDIPARRNSAIQLNPVRAATILLLDNLELAGK